ncbi:hypothetical protein [Streptomyces sp. NPDC007264]|uniref:hypothetical protein n=1 Tax=Streptomyces sp. NPDC007264 TaxID=3364777 RepID=UPI0036D8092F
MLQTRELLDSLTTKSPLNNEILAATIDALSTCEEAVTACAAGMATSQDGGSMGTAIALDLDCADSVLATRRILTRATGPNGALLGAQLEACLIACQRSHEECSRHSAHHEHCRLCADATRQAADACRQALTALRA